MCESWVSNIFHISDGVYVISGLTEHQWSKINCDMFLCNKIPGQVGNDANEQFVWMVLYIWLIVSIYLVCFVWLFSALMHYRWRRCAVRFFHRSLSLQAGPSMFMRRIVWGFNDTVVTPPRLFAAKKKSHFSFRCKWTNMNLIGYDKKDKLRGGFEFIDISRITDKLCGDWHNMV